MIKKSLIGLSLAAIAVAGCSRGSSDTLAIVNGESVPMSEYYKTLEMKGSVVAQVDPSRLNVDPASGSIPRQLTEVAIDSSYRLNVQALRDCINQTVTKQLAKDEGLYPTSKDVDDEIKFQEKRKPSYVKDLSATGMSVEQIKNDLAVNMAVVRLVGKGVTVTPTEVDEYIKGNPQEFTEPEQAVLAMIEVGDAKTKDLVDQELKGGQLFTTVAQHFSIQQDGKSRGYHVPETQVQRLSPLLKSLVAKTPEFSQTDWQYDNKGSGHWFKFYVEKKVKAKPLNIDDYVKEMIKRKLLVAKGSKVNDVNKRIGDKLKASKIEIKVDYLKDPWKKVYDSMTATPKEASTPAAK